MRQLAAYAYMRAGMGHARFGPARLGPARLGNLRRHEIASSAGYFREIGAAFDLNQIGASWLASNSVITFADFLPSFWAKGFLRALEFSI